MLDMQNDEKLSQLTQKLYQDGLEKGMAEGQAILEKAQKEANEILENARSKAQEIIDSATKEAQKTSEGLELELKRSLKRLSLDAKSALENSIIFKSTDSATKEAMQDVDFVKSLLKSCVDIFAKSIERGEVSFVLPEAQGKELEEYLKSILPQKLEGGFSVSKGFEHGFKIENKAEKYLISCTEDDFLNLLREYASERLNKILF